MKDALSFLRELKGAEPPSVVHLLGDDTWLRDTVRRRIVETWCGEEGASQVERLAGVDGARRLDSAFGSFSLFGERKAILLSDPLPGEKGRSLSAMGERQLQDFSESVRALPSDSNRLIVETGSPKKTGAFHRLMADLAVQVDTSPPTGGSRRKWVEMLVRKEGLRLETKLLETLNAAGVSLGVLAADMEKLALAVDEGQEASLELWESLTQAEPEATVWEIGDRLGRGQVGPAWAGLAALEGQGLTIHEILPSLLNWNQQRLRVRSFSVGGFQGGPPGVHPFVVKKTAGGLSRTPLAEIRREQKSLLYLDRCSKQSWENPRILLDRFLVEAGSRAKGEWRKS